MHPRSQHPIIDPLRTPAVPVISDDKGLYQYYLLTNAYDASGALPYYVSGGQEHKLRAGIFGNFAGLTEARLKAIKDMGMGAIWLSPVYESDPTKPGYTYNATDYRKVNPIYGSEADLKALIERAHVQGMGIVMDQVYNHTADQHPWFQASRDPSHPDHAKYRDYYVWQDPIRVGQADVAHHPEELKHAYKTDEQIASDAKQAGREGLTAIDVKLRDTKGHVLNKKRFSGDMLEELPESATIKLYPLSDWSKPILIDPAKPAQDGNVVIDEDKKWLFLPKRDEQGNILYPPNNYIAPSGDRVWDYDDKRGQVYKHAFDASMPDLNIGDPVVNDEILDVGKYWQDHFHVDGYRLDASRHAGTHPLLLKNGIQNGGKQAALLTKAFPETEALSPLGRQLFIAGMTSNPPNTLRALFKEENWENPSPSERIVKEIHRRFPETKAMSDEDMLMYLGTIDLEIPKAAQTGNLFSGGFRNWLHPRDIGQPTGLAFWKEFAAKMREKNPDFSLLHEFGDDPRLGMEYMRQGVGDYGYFSSLDNVKSIPDLRRSVEDTLSSLPKGKHVNWTPDNHDTSRIFTRMGFDPAVNEGAFTPEEKIAAQKLLLNFFSRLPGNVTIYNGAELGLGSPAGAEIKQNDARDPLSYFNHFTCRDDHARTHDFARAAYPWSTADQDTENIIGGQGRFFKTPASWKGRSYAEQKSDPRSVLHAFQKAMQLRIKDPVLSATGEMTFLNAPSGQENVLIYIRANERGSHLFMDNFTNQEIRIDLIQLAARYPANTVIQKLASGAQQHGADDAATIAIEPFGTKDIARINQHSGKKLR